MGAVIIFISEAWCRRGLLLPEIMKEKMALFNPPRIVSVSRRTDIPAFYTKEKRPLFNMRLSSVCGIFASFRAQGKI